MLYHKLKEILELNELYYKVKMLGIPAEELLDEEQMERYQEDDGCGKKD